MAEHAGMDNFGDLPTTKQFVKMVVGAVVVALAIGAVLYFGVF